MENKKISDDSRWQFMGWGKYELTLVVLFFFIFGFVFMDRLSVAYISPLLVEDFGLNNTQIGYIAFLTTGFFAISSTMFGMISDRMGTRKKWLIIFMIGSSLFALLGAVASSYEMLLAIRSLAGFFQGPILPIMMAIMAQESSKGKIGLNAGIVNMGTAVISVMLGPVLLTQIGGAFGWRMAFVATSLPILILGILVMPLVKEKGRVLAKVRKEKSGKKDHVFKNFVEVLKYRNVVICFLIGIFSMAGFWTLNNFGPLYWSVVGGFDIENIGFIIMGMGVLGMIYTVYVPKFTDDFGRKKGLILFYFLCFLALFALFALPGSNLALVIYCLLAGIPGCMLPLYMTIVPAETVPEHLSGTAQGLILGFAEIVGGSVWLIFAGMIADNMGLSFTMLIGALAFLVSLVLSIFLIETNTKEMRTEVRLERRLRKENKKKERECNYE